MCMYDCVHECAMRVYWHDNALKANDAHMYNMQSIVVVLIQKLVTKHVRGQEAAMPSCCYTCKPAQVSNLDSVSC